MDRQLLDAVKRGDVKSVNCLVALGADVNTGDNTLTLPLVLAADRRNIRMCLSLMNHGAFLDRTIADTSSPCIGHSPLSLAVCSGLTNAVSQLLMLGASVNVTPDWSVCAYNPRHVSPGSSLLHAAVATCDLAIINSLLRAGCAVNTQSADGDTPLHLVCRRRDSDLAERFIAATGEKLQVDAINCETQHTALWEAIERNDVPLAKCLLNAGADVNLKGGIFGMTAVHCAVVYKRELMLDLVLSATGCDVNVCDDYGWTPLHSAACRDAPLDGRSPLHFAASSGSGMCDVVTLLVEHGADVNSTSLEGQTPLVNAVEMGDFDTCRTLMFHGADLTYCQDGDSPLTCSIYRRHENISALLIAAGASVTLTHTRWVNMSRLLSNIYYILASKQLHLQNRAGIL